MAFQHVRADEERVARSSASAAPCVRSIIFGADVTLKHRKRLAGGTGRNGLNTNRVACAKIRGESCARRMVGAQRGAVQSHVCLRRVQFADDGIACLGHAWPSGVAAAIDGCFENEEGEFRDSVAGHLDVGGSPGSANAATLSTAH